jgi:hypothetical protein
VRRAAAVAGDVLREAIARRWVLAILAGVTAALTIVALGLRLDVVDGALAASRFFGRASAHRTMQAADVALRPLFEGAAALAFWGPAVGGVLACADFAPRLLAPGRIEHLLALPIRRVDLLAGTFLGVLALVLAGGAYGAGGLTAILWLKTGVFNPGPLAAGALAVVGFAAIYAPMLLAAVLTRSAALAALAGAVTLAVGVVASYREAAGPLLAPGLAREAVLAILSVFPRLATLGGAGIDVASATPIAWGRVGATAAGALAFAGAVLALAAARFERKDC